MRKLLFTFLVAVLSTVYASEPVNVLPSDSAKVYFISPDGSDSNQGTSAISPFRTINRGMKKAQPGDTVLLLPGIYYQDFYTVRSGQLGRPIQVIGSNKAVLKGSGASYIASIRHSYIEFSHFTINGHHGKGESLQDYRDKLIYIKGQKMRGITGIKIIAMHLENAFGECLRMKYLATNNEIAFNTISHCGKRDYLFGRGSHNGEGIYIGTAPEQIADGKNPSYDVDKSNHNWIHHNIINTFGSECIDIKEGSSHNLIEQNICSNEKDKNVGAISVRGNYNTIRNNILFLNTGAGLRFGGDTETDGIHNIAYGNYLDTNTNSSLKIMRLPQELICGNTVIKHKSGKSIRLPKNTKNHSDFLKSCCKE